MEMPSIFQNIDREMPHRKQVEEAKQEDLLIREENEQEHQMERPNESTKISRTQFTAYQKFVLNETFAVSPYVRSHEWQQIASRLGLTAKTVQMWFRNKRFKIRKSLKEDRAQQRPVCYENRRGVNRVGTSGAFNSFIRTSGRGRCQCGGRVTSTPYSRNSYPGSANIWPRDCPEGYIYQVPYAVPYQFHGYGPVLDSSHE